MNQDTGNAPGPVAGGQSTESTRVPRANSEQAAPGDGANQPVVTPAKTAKEISAAFKAVFGDVKAEMRNADKVSLAKRLAPYRKDVLLLRQAGKSWRAIAKGMRDPRIGERVTPESLSAVFGPEEAAATNAGNPIKPTG